MQADPEYLRQHFASLSDEALQAIDRADLVETAQKFYDDELQRREQPSYAREEKPEKPDWIEDASEVFARADFPGTAPAPDITSARDALEAAGIPCYLELSEIPEEEAAPKPTHLWRLMVPGHLNLHATSVLERDVFNADLEAEWRTHLETLSPEELLAMDPQVVFCGLFDRIERVTKAYDDEIARRKLRL
jgi:hypothetical protein